MTIVLEEQTKLDRHLRLLWIKWEAARAPTEGEVFADYRARVGGEPPDPYGIPPDCDPSVATWARVPDATFFDETPIFAWTGPESAAADPRAEVRTYRGRYPREGKLVRPNRQQRRGAAAQRRTGGRRAAGAAR